MGSIYPRINPGETTVRVISSSRIDRIIPRRAGGAPDIDSRLFLVFPKSVNDTENIIGGKGLSKDGKGGKFQCLLHQDGIANAVISTIMIGR